jgi:hypothetical protein
MKMKKMYEKPVATILRMEDSMQMICSSGFKNQTNIKVDKWEKTEETNANGTSQPIDSYPEWYNKL